MKTKRQRRDELKKTNTQKLKPLEAKTENQKDYIISIVENDIVENEDM